MAVQLKFYDKEFNQQIQRATRDGLKRATVFYHTQCRLAVNKSNRRGTEPSKPGEAPRKRTGFGQSGIVWEFDEAAIASRVGVTANARYMIFLELGTPPRVIRPKRANVLMIEWKGKVKPYKPKSKGKSKKRYYWAIPERGDAFLVQKDGGKYWYFRKRVRHPGMRPRPWLIPTLMRHKETIARLACTGGPPGLR